MDGAVSPSHRQKTNKNVQRIWLIFIFVICFLRLPPTRFYSTCWQSKAIILHHIKNIKKTRDHYQLFFWFKIYHLNNKIQNHLFRHFTSPIFLQHVSIEWFYQDLCNTTKVYPCCPIFYRGSDQKPKKGKNDQFQTLISRKLLITIAWTTHGRYPFVSRFRMIPHLTLTSDIFSFPIFIQPEACFQSNP